MEPSPASGGLSWDSSGPADGSVPPAMTGASVRPTAPSVADASRAERHPVAASAVVLAAERTGRVTGDTVEWRLRLRIEPAQAAPFEVHGRRDLPGTTVLFAGSRLQVFHVGTRWALRPEELTPRPRSAADERRAALEAADREALAEGNRRIEAERARAAAEHERAEAAWAAEQEALMRLSPARAPEGDLVTKLERLAALHERGALTDDEFAAAKRRLLR